MTGWYCTGPVNAPPLQSMQRYRSKQIHNVLCWRLKFVLMSVLCMADFRLLCCVMRLVFVRVWAWMWSLFTRLYWERPTYGWDHYQTKKVSLTAYTKTFCSLQSRVTTNSNITQIPIWPHTQYRTFFVHFPLSPLHQSLKKTKILRASVICPPNFSQIGYILRHIVNKQTRGENLIIFQLLKPERDHINDLFSWFKSLYNLFRCDSWTNL